MADDIDFAISHIMRGEDHVTNTARADRDLRGAGRAGAAFAHFPLLVGAGGEALSKRLGSLSLRTLREDGIEPMALASYLAKIGTSDAIEPAPVARRTGRRNSRSRRSAGRRRISILDELTALNAKTLHAHAL